MTDDDSISDYDVEDVEEIIPIIEKSFEIRFKQDAFLKVQTVGDLVDVIQSHIDNPHNNSCTSQAVFYAIRDAIGKTQSIDRYTIYPDSSLEELFPAANRRRRVRAFNQTLGIKTDFLEPHDWIIRVHLVGLILSLVSMIIIGFAGFALIAFFIISMTIANKLANKLTIGTVRELVEKIAGENYMVMRRYAGTVNKNEIWDTVVNVMSSRMGIDKKHITPNSRFSWAEPLQE